jgi:phage/plasmid-like protein (TIGR03299 family)
MAHLIDTTVNASGAIALAGRAAWHNLGTVFDTPMTSKDCLSVAGIGFETVRRVVGYQVLGADGEPTGEWRALPEYAANVRTDTGTGWVVGKDYVDLQNLTCFSSFDKVLSDAGAVYETAGILRDGAQIFISAKMPNEWRITDKPGDSLVEFLLLFNSHDGSSSVWMIPTLVRVVCANTLGAAMGFGFKNAHELVRQGRALRLRHASNTADKLAAAGEIFEAAVQRNRDAVDNARRLAELRCGAPLIEDVIEMTLQTFVGNETPRASRLAEAASGAILLDAILGNVEAVQAESKDLRTRRRETAGAAILAGIMAEAGDSQPSAWDVWNGVTGWTDHSLKYRGRRKAENRFNSLVAGRVDDFKSDLLEVLTASETRA